MISDSAVSGIVAYLGKYAAGAFLIFYALFKFLQLLLKDKDVLIQQLLQERQAAKTALIEQRAEFSKKIGALETRIDKLLDENAVMRGEIERMKGREELLIFFNSLNQGLGIESMKGVLSKELIAEVHRRSSSPEEPHSKEHYP